MSFGCCFLGVLGLGVTLNSLAMDPDESQEREAAGDGTGLTIEPTKSVDAKIGDL